jgi:hypothetical protein
VAGAGNRNRLELSELGAGLVDRCGGLLERRFEELVKRSGVPFAAYQRHTRRLLNQLDVTEQAVVDAQGVA